MNLNRQVFLIFLCFRMAPVPVRSDLGTTENSFDVLHNGKYSHRKDWICDPTGNRNTKICHYKPAAFHLTITTLGPKTVRPEIDATKSSDWLTSNRSFNLFMGNDDNIESLQQLSPIFNHMEFPTGLYQDFCYSLEFKVGGKDSTVDVDGNPACWQFIFAEYFKSANKSYRPYYKTLLHDVVEIIFSPDKLYNDGFDYYLFTRDGRCMSKLMPGSTVHSTDYRQCAIKLTRPSVVNRQGNPITRLYRDECYFVSFYTQEEWSGGCKYFKEGNDSRLNSYVYLFYDNPVVVQNMHDNYWLYLEHYDRQTRTVLCYGPERQLLTYVTATVNGKDAYNPECRVRITKNRLRRRVLNERELPTKYFLDSCYYVTFSNGKQWPGCDNFKVKPEFRRNFYSFFDKDVFLHDKYDDEWVFLEFFDTVTKTWHCYGPNKERLYYIFIVEGRETYNSECRLKISVLQKTK